MSGKSIFMPMKLEALVIDDLVGGGNTFRRWEFSYRRMEKYLTPVPDAMSNDKEIKERGIWLRWILPRELRTEEERGGFPLIPNRWLITRIEEETGHAASLVLESDCPAAACMPDEEYDRIMPYTSQYLVDEKTCRAFQQSADPYRSSAYIQKASWDGCSYVNLGVPFSLKDWQERDKDCLFLTACAPGNPDFTGYVPHNSNILSFFDNLKNEAPKTLHYSVIGWYSGGENQNLFLSGQVFSVPWKKEGYPVTKEEDRYKDELRQALDSGMLNVAVGETCDAAFRSYLQGMLTLSQRLTGEAQEKLGLLLAALQEGCPDWLEDAPGLYQLKDRLHRECFQEKYGGSAETAEFDKETEFLHSLREELQDAWWKMGYLKKNPANKTGRTAEDFQTLFDVSTEDSLLSRTIAQFEKVRLLYERQRSNGKEEKKRPLGRYWRMGNPYIFVSGLEAAKDLDQEKTVSRGLEDLIETKEPVPGIQDTEKLPSEVAALYREAFAILKEVYQKPGEPLGKTLPDYPVEAWHQPWKPVFMEWRVSYEERSFVFDGYGYRLSENKRSDPEKRRGFGGISPLDNHKKQSYADYIEKLSGNTQNQELAALAARIREWKLLGQELVNLQESMAQRDCRPFCRPYEEQIAGTPYTLDEVLGFCSEDQEFLERTGGSVESVPLVNANIIPDYHFLRSGILHMDDLIFYDAFGRALNLIRSGEEQGIYQSKNFPLIVPDSMRSGLDASDNGFLLKPGLLQYSRLALSFEVKKECPILGFLILNRLNHSLSLYAPDGAALGELMLMETGEEGRRVCYLPFQNKEACLAAQVKAEWPDLGKLIEAYTGQNETEFSAFLDVIDKAFWTMDAVRGNTEERTALAVGRPIALVQTEAWLELCGLPRKDAGWKADQNPLPPEQCFPMRLGDLSAQDDGVVGYFEDDTFSLFRSLAAPDQRVSGIRRIGEGEENAYLSVGFDRSQPKRAYVLCDPQLAIHAYTGIFPVKRLQMEKSMVLERLKRLEIYFRIGPLPARIKDDKGTEPAVEMSKPALPGGTFLWLERTDREEEYQMFSISPLNGCQQGSPDMREGALVFHKDENKETGEDSNG